MTTLETIRTIQSKMKSRDIRALEDMFALVLGLEAEDFDASHKINKEARGAALEGIRAAKSLDDMERFRELQKKTYLFDAKHEFDSFLTYVEWGREPQKKFYQPRRKVLLQVVDAMQSLVEDKLDLLSVSLPPGTGKSTLGIFLLSWVMGKYPDQPNLASGHSSFLTRSFYDGVLSILADREQYLWGDVFPEVRKIDTSAKDTTIHLGSSNRFKTLTTRSIEGSLTGVARCEKILYADDLVDGIESALSKDRMDKLWQFYTDNLRNRKKEGCKEVHVATRWSVHDPIGRLEQVYGDDPRARFIVVPALDENEESNFDYQHGVGFSTRYFLDMRDIMDDVSFKALFMNQPIEREGLLYDEDELRRYFELPEGRPDAVLSICDTKDTGKDYEFLPIVYQYGNDYYLEDCVYDNIATEILDEMCAEILVRHNVQMCQFESNSAGGRTADKVQEKVKARGGRTHITKKFTTTNKETKIIVNSPFVKERILFKDKSLYTKKSAYGKMMAALCSYTVAGKNKNDDAPDGLAQFAEYTQSLSGNRAAVFKRPF